MCFLGEATAVTPSTQMSAPSRLSLGVDTGRPVELVSTVSCGQDDTKEIVGASADSLK